MTPEQAKVIAKGDRVKLGELRGVVRQVERFEEHVGLVIDLESGGEAIVTGEMIDRVEVLGVEQPAWYEDLLGGTT
jgi:hypothetical protein